MGLKPHKMTLALPGSCDVMFQSTGGFLGVAWRYKQLAPASIEIGSPRAHVTGFPAISMLTGMPRVI